MRSTSMAKTALKDWRDVRRLKLQCIRNVHLFYLLHYKQK